MSIFVEHETCHAITSIERVAQKCGGSLPEHSFILLMPRPAIQKHRSFRPTEAWPNRKWRR